MSRKYDSAQSQMLFLRINFSGTGSHFFLTTLSTPRFRTRKKITFGSIGVFLFLITEHGKLTSPCGQVLRVDTGKCRKPCQCSHFRLSSATALKTLTISSLSARRSKLCETNDNDLTYNDSDAVPTSGCK